MPAMIEPKDTYRKINNTSMNTPKANKAAKGCSANTMPSKLATPLPPLNEANTGSVCPSTTHTPSKICQRMYVSVPILKGSNNMGIK